MISEDDLIQRIQISDILNLKTYSEFASFKYFISQRRTTEIDEFELLIKNAINKENISFPSFFDKWSHQTEKEAFLGNLFFPIQLEEPHDPITHCFYHLSIIKLLSISSRYRNPLAMYFSSKLLEGLYECEDDEIFQKSTQLMNQVVQHYTFESQKEKKNLKCNFSLAELSRLLGYKKEVCTSYYGNGKNLDIRCYSNIETDIDQLKIIFSEYPPAYQNLRLYDRENRDSYLNLVKDKCPYALYQLAMIQKSEENKLDFLIKAKEKNIFSAYIELADYYSYVGKIDEEISLLEEAGKKGLLYSYETYLLKFIYLYLNGVFTTT